jgi:hypothetical protein
MRDNRDQGIVSSMIILAIVIMFVLAISGCATAVPVVAKFPEPPGRLITQRCPDLQKLNDEARLSDISKTVAQNYSLYYECAVKTDAWIEWYNVQKILFEGAGK